MMSALFSGVSGLKSQQTSLDVIANNISNVNTTGYKAQRVSFSDLLSQTISSGSSATESSGGTNAAQVGLGVSVGSIDTLTTVGSTQSTGVTTDVSIGGEGYLVVQGGSQGEYQYTRAGNLSIDEEGNVTIDGYEVCGWDVGTDGSVVTDVDPTPLNIYSGKKTMAAEASENVTFDGVLDSSADASGTALYTIDTTASDFSYDQTTTATLYDAQGNTSDVTVSWKKCYTGTDSSGNAITTWYYSVANADGTAAFSDGTSSGFLTFDSSGNIVSTQDSTGTTLSTSDFTRQLTVQNSTGGTDASTVTLKFTDIITTNNSSATLTATTDGAASGELQSISISEDGTIVGTYSNDKTQTLGQLAIAMFNNAAGLERLGSNLYIASANSGDAVMVTAGSGGSGSLSSGTLEMSNVDLADQFTQMMISQRAYQANSKIISTADEMLQSLINMKS